MQLIKPLLLAFACACPISMAQAQLQVQSIVGPTYSPSDLVSSMVGPGITVSNIKFNQAGAVDDESQAAGLFSNGQSYVGMGSGAILSSGAVTDLPGTNDISNTSVTLNTGSDLDLESLATGTVYDSTVLEFSFVPTSDTISFEYVFLSEEYNEYVGSTFNDVFGFFVNGVNYATVGSNKDPVAVNSVNLGSNALLYINNDVHTSSVPNPISIEADGLTTVLTCTAPVIPNQVNTFKFAIGDVSDEGFDSWVMIKAGSFKNGRPILSSVHAADSISQPGAPNAYTVKFTNQEATSVTLSSARVEIPTSFSYRSNTTTGDVTANPTITGNVLAWSPALTIPANSSVSWSFGVNAASVSGTYFASADGEATLPVVPSGDTASVSIGIAQPIGYVRIGNTAPSQPSVPGLTDMAIGLPFEQPAEFIGNVSTIAGNTITFKSSPGFSPNRWVGSSPWVLQVESGSANGLNALISASTGDSVTVILEPGETLTDLAEDDRITIRKAQTPGNKYPVRSGAQNGHELFLFSGTSTGVNQSADTIYEYYDQVWYDMVDASIASDRVLHRSEGLIYRNPTTTAVNHLLAKGVVTSANQRVNLEKPGAGVAQDVRFSLVSALPVALESSGLGFTAGDMVFTFSKGTGMNKSANEIYSFLGGTSWEDSSGNPANPDLQPGDSFVLRRPSSAPVGYALWNRSQDYAASLPPVEIDPLAVAHPQLIPMPSMYSSQEFRFKFFAESGVTFKVQMSSDLVNWTTIETLTGAGIEVGRSDFSVQPVRKFYRVQRQ